MWLGAESLRGYTWLGQSAFRALSYAFTVKWNDECFVPPIAHALGPLSVPEDVWQRRSWPGEDRVERYWLLDAGASEERRYQIVRGYERLHSEPTLDKLLDYFFWRINTETIHASRDYYLLHAGVLECPDGGALLLPASSGSGKSTLATGLVRAGFGYLSDEFAPIDPIDRRVHAYPKAITLKAGSFSLFPEAAPVDAEATARQWHLLPQQLGGTFGSAPLDVRFVVAPRFVPGAATELRPLTRAETLIELSTCSLAHGPYGRRGFRLLTSIARDVRGYRLTTGSLRESVDAVAALAASAGASHSSLSA